MPRIFYIHPNVFTLTIGIIALIHNVVLTTAAAETSSSLSALPYSAPTGLQSDLAYSFISERVVANRGSFFVYHDADSGFNHGFPSGFFGATSKIGLNTGCIDDSTSATGCTTDSGRLDCSRGTVLQVRIAPLSPGEFVGVNIEEPQNWGVRRTGTGYDLRGATELVFDVRTPQPGGVRVEFGVGGPGHTTGFVPITSMWATQRIRLSTLNLSETDLANAHILFTIGTNDTNAPAGATVLLDNIRFEPVPRSQQGALGFPLSYQTCGVSPRDGSPFPFDQVLRNVTTIYDAALATIALLERGTSQDLAAARLVADTFVYALDHDNRGDPVPVAPNGGRALHNGYKSGDLGLHNGQDGGQAAAGEVRLAGFSCRVSSTGFCLVLDGATGGNNAFAILALTAAYRQFSDPRYLEAARTIGRWIIGNLADNTGTGYGGYYLGYPDEGTPPPKLLLRGKSVENNADIFAAFTALAALERQVNNPAQAAEWTTRANIAGDFVIALFDTSSGCFNAGTVPIGTPSAAGITPNGAVRGNDIINTFKFLDAQSFTTLALAAAPRYRDQLDWRRPVQCTLSMFSQTVAAGGNTFRGFSISQSPSSGPQGIAWEFTGQTVVLARFVDRLYGQAGFEGTARLYLDQLQQAQQLAPFQDGRGVVASTLQDGDRLPPGEQCLNTAFQCIPQRPALVATTWAIFAEQDTNPLARCEPRPDVQVRPAPGMPGTLRVTVAARGNINTPRHLVRDLAFTRLDNVVVQDLSGQLPQREVSFSLQRVTAGETAGTAHLTVVDSCGTWPTFVGGGPAAWGGVASGVVQPQPSAVPTMLVRPLTLTPSPVPSPTTLIDKVSRETPLPTATVMRTPAILVQAQTGGQQAAPLANRAPQLVPGPHAAATSSTFSVPAVQGMTRGQTPHVNSVPWIPVLPIPQRPPAVWPLLPAVIRPLPPPPVAPLMPPMWPPLPSEDEPTVEPMLEP